MAIQPILDQFEPEISEDALLRPATRKALNSSRVLAVAIALFGLVYSLLLNWNIILVLEPIPLLSLLFPAILSQAWFLRLRTLSKSKDVIKKSNPWMMLFRFLAACLWVPFCIIDSIGGLMEFARYYELVINKEMTLFLLVSDLFIRTIELAFIFFYLRFEFLFFKRHMLFG